jgi:hypothetical protein
MVPRCEDEQGSHDVRGSRRPCARRWARSPPATQSSSPGPAQRSGPASSTPLRGDRPGRWPRPTPPVSRKTMETTSSCASPLPAGSARLRRPASPDALRPTAGHESRVAFSNRSPTMPPADAERTPPTSASRGSGRMPLCSVVTPRAPAHGRRVLPGCAPRGKRLRRWD